MNKKKECTCLFKGYNPEIDDKGICERCNLKRPKDLRGFKKAIFEKNKKRRDMRTQKHKDNSKYDRNKEKDNFNRRLREEGL